MKVLRIRQVMQLTGLSRMAIYRLELAGEFPKRRQLSKNSVERLESGVVAWAESRPPARVGEGRRRGEPVGGADPRRDHPGGVLGAPMSEDQCVDTLVTGAAPGPCTSVRGTSNEGVPFPQVIDGTQINFENGRSIWGVRPLLGKKSMRYVRKLVTYPLLTFRAKGIND